MFWERLLVQAKQDAQQEHHHVQELKHVLSKTQEAGSSTVRAGEGHKFLLAAWGKRKPSQGGLCRQLRREL